MTPDHFTLAKKPQIKVLERRLGNKPVRLIAAPDKGGLTSEAVPAADRGQPALTTEELLQVGSYGAQLEEYFGGPQDIEFAVDREGRLLLLQSRPLTLLEPEGESEPSACDSGAPPRLDRPRQRRPASAWPPARFSSSAGMKTWPAFPEGAVLVAAPHFLQLRRRAP